jgi:outer membrane protein OmpA-like peptidoglycan-associated protein/tetratricopeptide (TPR) repeat protein
MIYLQDSFKMKTMQRILIVLLVFFIQFLSAQEQDLKLAKIYFDRTYYSKAIPLYANAIQEKRSLEVVRNLADSYYFTNDFAAALKLYSYLVRTYGQNLEEEYYFRYIQTLKAAGDYAEANAILRKYLTEKNNIDAVVQLEKDTEELENISAIGNRFEIKNLPINTKYSEFGSVKKGDLLVFSSIRSNKDLFDKVYPWNNENYLDLNTIPLQNLIAGDSITTSFSKEINTNMHESNAVFTKDGKTMYFTRNNFKKGKRAKNKQKISKLQIYSAELIDGKWTNITSLPFNSDDYSTEHPALSLDEKTLYFASDMPGSLGSFDLFSVKINNGTFETPKNLGATINTTKKEQFPFVANDNKLYFSSNGHFGYGMMDVFVSEMKGDSFSRPLNVGLPVNSGYDDFAFNIDAQTKTGYFSSNRLEGKGSDDIYDLKEIKPLIIESCKQSIAGTITDADTKLPLGNALVVLQNKETKEVERRTTTSDGTFSFSVGCSTSYTVLASKEGYSKNSKMVVLQKERNKINDASMVLKSEKARLEEEKIALEKLNKEKEIALEKLKKEKVADILSKEKDVVRDKDRLIIKTPPIYFDFDLWYIRKESKIILNRVVELMKKYPEMEVEIGSHTDVRGNDAYNLELSSKRAKSTQEYIISQGIPAKRILAKGYGETVLIIQCVPEESCSEEQHELNRRSEFVIKNL